MLAACRRGGASRVLARLARRHAHDAVKKPEKPPIVPMWKTTESFKTISDLPPREVLKAELEQMAEEKNGFLFGEVPPPPGQSRKWEDWELLWLVGIGGTLIYVAVGMNFKPDCNLDTWARYEALKRKRALEESGEDWLALMRAGGAAPPVEE